MKLQDLFQEALGICPPWEVTALKFSVQEGRLDITIDFPRGSTFPCPDCGAKGAKAYDTQQEEWRHLNFFQYGSYLHARVPRVSCPQVCGIKRIEVPWARPGTGFTLLFETYIMALMQEMPVAAVARLIGEHDTRLWRIMHHYIDQARSNLDFSQVSRIGVDETSSRKGHNYISLFFDMDEKRLLFGTQGKDQETVRAFSQDLVAHQGDPESIDQVCCDMSPAFIAGVQEHFPEASITFDRFHIMKIMGNAVDQVRREESKGTDVLKRTRYLWLKNPCNLTPRQRQMMETLSHHNLKTSRAYQIRLTLQELFTHPTREAGEAFLKRWYFWATHSRLQPVIEAAKTIKRHWEGILNWFDSGLTTGFLEGINSLIQAAKARARGYRTSRNIIAISYLIAGKLDFELPT